MSTAPGSASWRHVLIGGINGNGVDAHPVHVLEDGTVVVTPGPGSVVDIAHPTTAIVTSIAQSTTVQTFVVANAVRKGLIVHNESARGFLFLKLGGGASSTDFSVKLLPGAAFELPFPTYVGQLTGVWSLSGGGSAQVSEMI